MESLVDQYLASNPPEVVYRFLRISFRDLAARHGSVVGIRVPIPKLLPLPKSA
jgi:hypothetical protein